MAPTLRTAAMIAAGLAAAGAIAWWTFQPQPVPVDLARVERGVLEVYRTIIETLQGFAVALLA